MRYNQEHQKNKGSTHTTSAKLQTAPAYKKLRVKPAGHKQMVTDTVTVTDPAPEHDPTFKQLLNKLMDLYATYLSHT
jgi:hypothetical protein